LSALACETVCPALQHNGTRLILLHDLAYDRLEHSSVGRHEGRVGIRMWIRIVIRVRIVKRG
jgi:hypothetical protein